MKNSLFRHLDQRLGLSPLLRALKASRPADYLSPLDAPPISPGHVALLLIIALMLSGLGMTFYYSPTAERAAASLAHLHQEQPLGWLLHNIHRWSALLLITFVILHMLRIWLTRAYRYPRDLNWWLGLCLLLLVFVMGGTGYLLRWDIKAFTLMDLVISNLSDVPGLGDIFVVILFGGSEPDVVPLYRGYAFHVWFLPMLLFSLVALHLLVVWKQGLSEIPDAWRRLLEIYPGSRRINLLPGLLVLVVLVALSAVTPHGDQNDPMARSGWPHPDWLLMFYFLPFWFFKGDSRILGTLIIPAALLFFLALAPRLSRAGSRRGLVLGLAAIGVVGIIWLFGQTSKMGYEVPLQGCNACHRPTIIGGAPSQLSEFDIRDPDWIVFHLQDPQGSLLVPFETPNEAR
jgi:quinol-cytochrome oxidoreductase complex cytochrome b subunit